MTKHTDTARSGHPIEEALRLVREILDGLADEPAWSMDAATTGRVVGLAAQVVAGVAEVEARGIAQAQALDLPGAAQCRNVARWLQQTTHVTGRTASAKARLAQSLGEHEVSRVAMARGEVHAEQVGAIATVLADLGDDVSDDDKQRAEVFLLEHATEHDADDLAGLGREIAIRLDPEGADAKEAAVLERQEERARAKTRLSMYDDTEGMTHGRFSIPALHGATLRKALAAFAAPKSVRGTQGAGSYDWQTPTPLKLGQAFVSYIERFPIKKVPKIGGLNATVNVIGDYEILQGSTTGAPSRATCVTCTTRDPGPTAARPACATLKSFAPSTTASPTPASRSRPTRCGHRDGHPHAARRGLQRPPATSHQPYPSLSSTALASSRARVASSRVA
ncbi:MAG: nuclease [Spirosoma sp.]|nr:nuclease [Spirosoma sp.]